MMLLRLLVQVQRLSSSLGLKRKWSLITLITLMILLVLFQILYSTTEEVAAVANYRQLNEFKLHEVANKVEGIRKNDDGANTAVVLADHAISRELPWINPITIKIAGAAIGAIIGYLVCNDDDGDVTIDIDGDVEGDVNIRVNSNGDIEVDVDGDVGGDVNIIIETDDGTQNCPNAGVDPCHLGDVPTTCTIAPSTSAPTPSTPPPTPAPTCPPGSDPGACPDPHLWTWKGMTYDYHGQCDLIYTTCPNFNNGEGLDIYLRTEFVLPLKWSTISSLALKIGKDVFELQSNGSYYLNGEPNVDVEGIYISGRKLSHRAEAIPEKQTTRTYYTFALNDIVSIELVRTTMYERKSVGFKIVGVHDYRRSGGDSFNECVGLSSTWDHPDHKKEFLIGRTGSVYNKWDAVDFGPEWQVDLTKGDQMLFVEDIGQQLPNGEKCIDSPLQVKGQRHLEELHAAEGGALARRAEEACSHLNSGDDLFDACFFDVLVTGDVTFAQEPWYDAAGGGGRKLEGCTSSTTTE